ncbi:MAG: hypothetical protein EOP11_11160 [Proteobacteria bacterium]|nr:MAG: hypothetical protein EOP11_11160 [Pseudomonadota bacterium]
MNSTMWLTLLSPEIAHAASDGFARTLTGQAGMLGLLGLEVVVWHLRPWRPAGRVNDALALAFLAALVAQFALGAYAAHSAFSTYLLPAGAIGFLLLIMPLLMFGESFSRAKLVTLGWLLLAGLTVLTFAIRHVGELYFELGRVQEELVFAARFNRGQGLSAWLGGFFVDDILLFFWWVIAFALVGAAFLILALKSPPKAPARRVRPMRRRR